MAVLRRFTKTLGFSTLATDGREVTVIPLKGYSNWGQVGPFAWLTRELLSEAIRIFVILDRDYRPDAVAARVEEEFAAQGVSIHVWRRKELESYLITPEVVARKAGAPLSKVREMLDSITASMGGYVFGQMLAERLRVEVSATRHASQVTSSFKEEFDRLWQDGEYRLYASPPKQIVSELNKQLRETEYRPVSLRALAAAHRRDEICPEMVAALRRVEGAIGSK